MCFDISEVNVAEKQEEKVVHVKYEYFSSTRTQTVRPFHFFRDSIKHVRAKKEKREEKKERKRRKKKKRWLVLGCIEADLCVQIRIFRNFRDLQSPLSGEKKVQALFFSRKKKNIWRRAAAAAT